MSGSAAEGSRLERAADRRSRTLAPATWFGDPFIFLNLLARAPKVHLLISPGHRPGNSANQHAFALNGQHPSFGPCQGGAFTWALVSQGDASLCPGLTSRGAFGAKPGTHHPPDA